MQSLRWRREEKISWPEEYAEHREELDAYPGRFHPVSRSRLQLTRPFNLTGGPALALSGMPTSIQVIGRHFEDHTVLKVGHAFETALGLRSRRPAMAAV